MEGATFLWHALGKSFSCPVFARRKARVTSPLPPPNYPLSPEQPDLATVGTGTVDAAEESCQQVQEEDATIQGTPSFTAIDQTPSPTPKTSASLEEEAVGETSSTVIPRPRSKVNGFVLLTYFLVSLIILSLDPASSSLTLF